MGDKPRHGHVIPARRHPVDCCPHGYPRFGGGFLWSHFDFFLKFYNLECTFRAAAKPPAGGGYPLCHGG